MEGCIILYYMSDDSSVPVQQDVMSVSSLNALLMQLKNYLSVPSTSAVLETVNSSSVRPAFLVGLLTAVGAGHYFSLDWWPLSAVCVIFAILTYLGWETKHTKIAVSSFACFVVVAVVMSCVYFPPEYTSECTDLYLQRPHIASLLQEKELSLPTPKWQNKKSLPYIRNNEYLQLVNNYVNNLPSKSGFFIS